MAATSGSASKARARASALAAGCPVIVNAHSGHPGTAELVGLAVVEAARETGMPEGVFSLLYGADYGVGQALVRHPAVRGVGFTGSRAGGTALMAVAAALAAVCRGWADRPTCRIS